MNTYQIQEELSVRIADIEEEESRLQEWLECLQRVGAIAAEWKVELPQIQSKPAVRSEPVPQKVTPVEPVAEATERIEEETEPPAEGRSVAWDRDRFESNLQQLRQSGVQDKETERLQEEELDQLREQLCASRRKSSFGGRLGTLMSFLVKV